MFTKNTEKKPFRKTNAKKLLLVFVIVIAMSSVASVATASSYETIRKWEVYEINLNTTNTYSNPYKNVTLSATFNDPNEKEIIIDGFWDGGNTWKVRMVPTEVGTWTYTTKSNDDQLNGTTGIFETISSDKKGFIKINPDYPYSFMYNDGTPFFWMGDTLWDDPGYDRFKDYIDLISSYGYNSYHTIPAHDRYDYQSIGGMTPFEMISPDERDYDRLRPDFFKEIDKRVIYANSKGIIPQLYFTWAQEFVKFDRSQFESFVRYMVARYAAYNVIWVVSGEFEEESTPSEYAYHGNVIYQSDPYKHPISIHTLDSNNEFGNDAWLTYIMHQTNTGVHTKIINDRIYNKPIVNGESQYLIDSRITVGDWRKLHWSIVMAGGYFDTGYQYIFFDPDNHYQEPYTGWNLNYPTNLEGMVQMKHLYDFFQKAEFWNMAPSDNLITSGTAFCLADPGNEYVIYIPSGGSVTVDLSDATGTLNLEWYNPKDGTYYDKGTIIGGGYGILAPYSSTVRSLEVESGTINGGGYETFTPPFLGDAVLHIVSKSIFDTGNGTCTTYYGGIHNGTIKPSDDIIVHKIYTYPCLGTEGHSEYVKIWNVSEIVAEGNWTNYGEDLSTIYFNKVFVLKANETYNYTIHTSSYPQMIHKQIENVTGGTITCKEFVDVNGQTHNDLIPAIKLYSADVESSSLNISNIIDECENKPVQTDISESATYKLYSRVVNKIIKIFKSIKEFGSEPISKV